MVNRKVCFNGTTMQLNDQDAVKELCDLIEHEAAKHS